MHEKARDVACGHAETCIVQFFFQGRFFSNCRWLVADLFFPSRVWLAWTNDLLCFL